MPKAKVVKKSTKKKSAPTKAETVDISEGVQLLLGDNGPPTKDVMYHYETILGLMEKASTAASKVSDAKKKAKEAGVDVSALMLSKKMLRMDPLDLVSLLKQTVVLMRENGAPVQLGLYETKFGSIEEHAAHEGWHDGINAKNMNISRWPENSPGHKEYSRRWNDAQAELAMKLGKPSAEGETAH